MNDVSSTDLASDQVTGPPSPGKGWNWVRGTTSSRLELCELGIKLMKLAGDHSLSISPDAKAGLEKAVNNVLLELEHDCQAALDVATKQKGAAA